MVDRHRNEFQGRLGHIKHINAKGGGFEAEGALGMSYYNSHRRRRHHVPRVLGVVIVLAAVLILLKAGMQLAIGADAYDFRIAAMKSGTTVDQWGAYLLHADPVTLALAAQFRRFIR